MDSLTMALEKDRKDDTSKERRDRTRALSWIFSLNCCVNCLAISTLIMKIFTFSEAKRIDVKSIAQMKHNKHCRVPVSIVKSDGLSLNRKCPLTLARHFPPKQTELRLPDFLTKDPTGCSVLTAETSPSRSARLRQYLEYLRYNTFIHNYLVLCFNSTNLNAALKFMSNGGVVRCTVKSMAEHRDNFERLRLTDDSD
ncbi:hypothetical protein WN51_11379 [Melipona quadrifasciata]|uniref:Uncharacterized protein n=1 Tax=Melipona quadrifasciata TaxID=166423 RepID=A0A0M9ABI7_9HYME|nr:hypothetical protein WN51_11379 [Melipona quadrifasciata]